MGIIRTQLMGVVHQDPVDLANASAARAGRVRQESKRHHLQHREDIH